MRCFCGLVAICRLLVAATVWLMKWVCMCLTVLLAAAGSAYRGTNSHRRSGQELCWPLLLVLILMVWIL
jgi:hypothetical protein